jgi:hypothetical protein
MLRFSSLIHYVDLRKKMTNNVKNKFVSSEDAQAPCITYLLCTYSPLTKQFFLQNYGFTKRQFFRRKYILNRNIGPRLPWISTRVRRPGRPESSSGWTSTPTAGSLGNSSIGLLVCEKNAQTVAQRIFAKI